MRRWVERVDSAVLVTLCGPLGQVLGVENSTRQLCCHGFMQFNPDNMHGVRLAELLVDMLADGMGDSDALKDLLTSHLFRH
jgi:hypothetical protein